jgi:hypothetical protein
MRILLFSGLLYLVGVGIVLAIKPSFMFTSDGGWKEFGIGRNPERFTWFPFWLFTVVWALISFFIVQLIASFGVLPGTEWTQIETVEPVKPISRARKANISQAALVEKASNDLKPGYYMLNTEGTSVEGVPKYIYIGQSPSTD